MKTFNDLQKGDKVYKRIGTDIREYTLSESFKRFKNKYVADATFLNANGWTYSTTLSICNTALSKVECQKSHLFSDRKAM